MNQNEQKPPTLQVIHGLAEELNVTCASSEYTFDLDAKSQPGEPTLRGTYQKNPQGITIAYGDLVRYCQQRNQLQAAVHLHALLNIDPDLTMYEIKPGDRETKADISVADWKEALLAINVSSRRIYCLLEDVKRAEARIDSLKHDLRSIADYHEL